MAVTLHLDLHEPLQPQDVFASKSQQLRYTQAQTRLRDDHCPAPIGDGIGQRFDLLDCEGNDLFRLVSGQRDAHDRRDSHEAIQDGAVVDGF